MLTVDERMQYLHQNRWTCRRLAHEIGCAPSTVWRALNHNQGSEHWKARIAEKLEIDTERLFGPESQPAA